MSNTIDININKGDNSMKPLVFTWSAIFKDGTKIEQFEDGIEHLFKEVKDKFNDLVFFNLSDQKGHMFTVDLLNGRIGYNYLPLPYLEKTEKKNIRLIFFRRHKIEMAEKMIEKSHNIEYHLGLQYNLKDGQNRKIVLIIDNEGNFVTED